jgi:hypothetical protein
VLDVLSVQQAEQGMGVKVRLIEHWTIWERVAAGSIYLCGTDSATAALVTIWGEDLPSESDSIFSILSGSHNAVES